MLALAPGWELDVERGPDWLLARLKCPGRSSGDLAFDTPPLAKTLWAVLEQHFTYRLVLELDQVDLLNSHLIGQLVELYKRIREHDGVLRLCGLSAYNRQVLRACRLENRFWAYHNREEAVLGTRRLIRQPK
jgi:anti-anti-sigma factor